MTTTTDKITDTTMRGLQIGVLAGVSDGIMKNINRMFGKKPSRRKRSKKKR